jgi:hypothetical protein
MPKGNNYPATVEAAQVQAATEAFSKAAEALNFIPNLGPDVKTTASISPERLPLADLAVRAAAAAPDVMRKSFKPEALQAKLAAYRLLVGLLGQLETLVKRLQNALNVLGGDIRFMVDNVHEDIEKDNGETQDLGELRKQIHDYYKREGNGGGSKPKP